MRKLLALGASLVTSLLALEARADDTSLEGLLAEEVVTSVSKSAESSHDAPALTRGISAEEIHRYGMTSVAEALDFLGIGAHVESKLGRSELTVRGVNFTGDRGNHVLVLLDGHAINEPLIGDASLDQRLGVPLELIDHIELVVGPGSAVYGTSAVLAVVNVVTKTAKTLAGLHLTAEAGAVGTLRLTATAGHSFELLHKRAEITAGVSHYQQDGSIDFPRQDLGTDASGRKLTWGGTADDAYRARATGVRLRFVRDGLEVSGRAVFSDFGDLPAVGDFDHANNGDIQRRASLVVSQRFSLGKVGDLTASVFGKAYDGRHRLLNTLQPQCAAVGCDYREYESSNRLGGEVRANFDWLQNGRILTGVGTSASLDHVDASSMTVNNTNQLLLAPVEHAVDINSVVNVAANAQQTLKPFSWLDLIAGGRVDWRKMSDDDGESLTFKPVFTPRLALAVRPWSGGTAKLIYAEAFRAPNPYESDARSPVLIHANQLQPETARSAEAIFEQRIDAHRFTVGAFRSDYRGIIRRVVLSAEEDRAAYLAGLTPILPSATSPAYQFRADDRISTHGFNLGFDGTAIDHRFHYATSFTAALARADGFERIAAAPQIFGNARVAYDLGCTLPTVALATTFAGRSASDRGRDAGFQQVTMAPPSLELRATLTGRVPWVKGLSYRAIVSHTTNATTPFAVGPTLRATTGFERVPLTPTERWNAILGLQYDFGD